MQKMPTSSSLTYFHKKPLKWSDDKWKLQCLWLPTFDAHFAALYALNFLSHCIGMKRFFELLLQNCLYTYFKKCAYAFGDKIKK